MDVAQFTVESHLATNVMKMMIYRVRMAYEGVLMTGLMQVVNRLDLQDYCQNLLSTSLLQVLSTSSNN